MSRVLIDAREILRLSQVFFTWRFFPDSSRHLIPTTFKFSEENVGFFYLFWGGREGVGEGGVGGLSQDSSFWVIINSCIYLRPLILWKETKFSE